MTCTVPRYRPTPVMEFYCDGCSKTVEIPVPDAFVNGVLQHSCGTTLQIEWRPAAPTA
jgi:hypothetical protein